MDKLKRYLIKGISFLMVVIILVATPLSDYADTQGIGQSHAMGSGGIIPLITGGSLMPFLGWALGVGITVAGASYIYDEYKEYVYYGGDTDLISIVDNLAEGVSELNITDKLINSFASFLEDVKGIDLDSGVSSVVYQSGATHIDTLERTSVNNSFLEYYETIKEPYDFLIVENTGFGYYIFGFSAKESWFTQENTVNAYYRFDYDGTDFAGFGLAQFSSVSGMFVQGDYWYNIPYRYVQSTADGWSVTKSSNTRVYPKYFDKCKTVNGFYVHDDMTSSWNLNSGTLSDFVGSANAGLQEATSYGNYDIANVNTLAGSTVTGTQVEAVNTSVSTAFPQQDSSELTEEQRAALVAALVAQALAEADITSGGNQEPDDDDNNNDDNQGEVENPNLVAPPITPPEYGEDLEVSNEITVGDQAIIDQSVTNTNGIITGLNNIVSSIGNIADGIGDVLANPLGAIKTAIDSVAESVWDFFANPIGNIIELIGDIFSAILSLPSMIIMELLKPLLTELFVPDTEGLMERISILVPIVSIIDTLGKFFNCFSLIDGSEPPYMYIHFENAEDERFQAIGTLRILDMAWYEPYKPYGDLIFSCVIWLFLMLRIFKAIPSILNGMSGGGEIPDSTYEPSGDTPFARIETRSFTMK